MARMPIGQPQSVPDSDGELYDREMAKIRARRRAEDIGFDPLDAAGKAFHAFQAGPKIPRPNTLETLIPVIGPGWEALGDLQDGDYAGAALNTGAALLDLAPIGEVAKGARAARKGVGLLNEGSKTADSSRMVLRRAGLSKPGEEIHHTFPLNGIGRNTPDWRNHYLFLKSLPKEQHRRLTGTWNGLPRYDPIRRGWYGTADWIKGAFGSGAGHSLTAAEHSNDS